MVSSPFKIDHNRPLITVEDCAAVQAVLTSGWIAQGTRVQAVEGFFERLLGGGKACAVSSGTAALYLALRAMGVGRGDLVAVPTYACSALLNAVNLAGAAPCPVDVDAASFNLDPRALSDQAAEARCVIAVHTYGADAEIAAIRGEGRLVIEDCCHTPGGSGQAGIQGQIGDAAVFSFYATKLITGGQGGLVWSNNREIAGEVEDYRQFDCRDAYYPRFNFQMTDIQAALVESQLKRFELIRMRRKEITTAYLENLPKGLSVQIGLEDRGRIPYRFVVITTDVSVRDALRAHMDRAGITCAVPLARHELLHRYLGIDPMKFPVAERLVDTTLSLPIHLCLSAAEVGHIAATLSTFKP